MKMDGSVHSLSNFRPGLTRFRADLRYMAVVRTPGLKQLDLAISSCGVCAAVWRSGTDGRQF